MTELHTKLLIYAAIMVVGITFLAYLFIRDKRKYK